MSSLSLNMLSSFWANVFPKNEAGKFYFPNQVSCMLIITFILAIIIIIVGIKLKHLDPKKKTPLWAMPFVFIVSIVNNFTKANIGKRWKHYAPYFTSIAIYMFILNISAIFGATTPTSYIMLNLGFALISFFMIQITGIISLGLKNYLKSFIGPVPWLCIIMIPINIISEFALPVSLTLRLMGNILSGGVISKLIVGMAGWISIPILPLINAYFDLMSGAIQTFVFVMLTIIFTSMKIDDSEKIY